MAERCQLALPRGRPSPILYADPTLNPMKAEAPATISRGGMEESLLASVSPKPGRRAPLKEQLRVWVREGIANGTFGEGVAIPSINMLKNRFGVARETVRQALEDLVAEGVLVPQHGRGYFVNSRGERILRVALAGKVDGVYIGPVYRGLVNELGETASVIAVDPRQQAEVLRRLVEGFAHSHGIDRLLVIPPRGHEKEFGDAVRPFRRCFRVAWLDRAPPGTKDACFLPDYPACVKLAVDHLRSVGLTRIHYFTTAPEDRSVFSAMRRTFLRIMQSRKGKGPDQLVSDGKHAVELAAANAGNGIGFVTENDRDALRLLTLLTAAGIQVPRDASIVSCDNSSWTDAVSPAITAVDPGFEEIGRVAARWIRMSDEGGNDGRGARKIKISPRLVRKGTTP
jgi:DNA-binding LacI/PurR family transcriptional regulator